MNNNDNLTQEDVLKLLDLPDDGTYIISRIEIKDREKHVYIEKRLEPVYCPKCNSRMHSKGFYTRTVNHAVFQDTMKLYVIVRQRKWHCEYCGLYLNDTFPFVERYAQSTNITLVLILNAFKDLSVSTAEIARRFNISDTQAHDLFNAHVDLPRLPLPEYISVDEVFLDISDSDKYAFVIMDFSNGQIVDIVHNRWNSTLENYFLSIPLEERRNVKGVICDAYRTYLTMPENYFPNACTILDSFHVVKLLIQWLNNYVNKVMKRYKDRDAKTLEQKNHDTNRDDKTIKASREVVLLRSYRWVLLKNVDDINYSFKRFYHRLLGMNVDTSTIERMFFELDPNFKPLRDLKEKYIEFNRSQFNSTSDALVELDRLIQEYESCPQTIFNDFATFLKQHRIPIKNSFTIVKVFRKSARYEKEYYARLSNGPMESFNRQPKDLKRNSRGFSDFHYTRNRILWSNRINPSFKSVSKKKKRQGKKRGPYKK